MKKAEKKTWNNNSKIGKKKTKTKKTTKKNK